MDNSKLYIGKINGLYAENDTNAFARAFLSLEIDNKFDEAMEDNKQIETIFQLCIEYLDKDVANKEDVEQQIGQAVKNLS